MVALFGTETGDTWTGIGIAWAVYVVIIVGALWARNRVAYCLLWAFLVLLLVTNVVGCHQDIVDFSNS